MNHSNTWLRWPTMTEQHALEFGGWVMTFLNLLCGLVTLDDFNLIVGIVGAITLLITNVVKLVLAVKYLTEIAKTKFKRQPPPPTDEK